MSGARRGQRVSKEARDEIVAFFRSVRERRFSDAEKALSAIRERRIGGVEFKEGYLNALDGILLSVRSGDPRDFVNRIAFDPRSLDRYRREFGFMVRNGIHPPFDAGYLSAWSDFLHYHSNSETKR